MSADQPGAPSGMPPGMSNGTPLPGDDEYVITSIGAPTSKSSGRGRPGQNGTGPSSASESSAGVATRTSRLPAIIEDSPLARELVIHAASFVHGVRRATSPETILRVRAEMKRELKRARKARKAEMKAALREYRARHRADVPADSSGSSGSGGTR